VHGPPVYRPYADAIFTDLLEWQPELVISDCEPFTAMAAKVLEVPLWYCSTMLQLTGIEHERKEIASKLFDAQKAKIEELPIADKYLVYSPLCDIDVPPFLKEGFEWVRPYAQKPQNTMSTEEVDLSLVTRAVPEGVLLTTAETSFVSDCLYARKGFYTCPNPNDTEQLLNAQLLEWYGVAKNLGRPKSIQFAVSQVEKHPVRPLVVQALQNWKQLDERIDDEAHH